MDSLTHLIHPHLSRYRRRICRRPCARAYRARPLEGRLIRRPRCELGTRSVDGTGRHGLFVDSAHRYLREGLPMLRIPVRSKFVKSGPKHFLITNYSGKYDTY